MEHIVGNMRKRLSTSVNKVQLFFRKHFCLGVDEPADECYNTLLHLAAKSGNERKVLQLLRRGANVNAKNFEDDTALHVAVEYGHANIIDILIHRGAQIEGRKFSGRTPIHMIAKCPNQMECLNLLVKYGANINARDVTGNNLLHLIIKSRKRNIAVVKKLLEYGSDVNMVDSLDNNCLHTLSLCYTISTRDLKIITQALVDKGINVNFRNFFGETALHKAIEFNLSNFTRFLVQNGAELNITNNQNLNAISLALKYRSSGCIKVLIKHQILEKHRGNPVDTYVNQQIQKDKVLSKIYKYYEDELRSLRKIKIAYFSDNSYYDVLCGDVMDVSKIVRKERSLYVLRHLAVDTPNYFWEFVDAWNFAVAKIEQPNFVDFIDYPIMEPDISFA